MDMSANLLKGLYSVIGHRGFYFKNPNGFDGLSGATVQITKNYKTLGEMLGDKGTVSQTAEYLESKPWLSSILAEQRFYMEEDRKGREREKSPLSFNIIAAQLRLNSTQ